MKLDPMLVRHIDLSRERRGPPGDGRPMLAVLWWRDLPLGYVAGTADEVPFSGTALEALLARLAAEQRAARDPALGAPLQGGAEGDPKWRVTAFEAARCESTMDWLDTVSRLPPEPAGDLAVIICTRDRGEALTTCLTALAEQDSPPGEVIIVDNSRDQTARAICEGRPHVRYVHEPRPGLSHARNAGIRAASLPLVAFTDDDVQPTPLWTSEVVRTFRSSDAEAMTGLVLPSRLDASAQVFFQMRMGGFGTRFVPVRYDGVLYQETLREGPHVWRIGAGANMAFRRSVFDRVGLFDTRLGAGASGCSEDSEMWYRVIATGGACQYEPRAVVMHDHRSDWPGLERQMRAYMKGHVSALVAQADRFGDRGNMRRIWRQLPRYFLRELLESTHAQEPERRRILAQEVIGWATGLRYLAPGWRRSATPLESPQ